MRPSATFGRGMDRLASARRKSLNIEIIEMGEPLFAYKPHRVSRRLAQMGRHRRVDRTDEFRAGAGRAQGRGRIGRTVDLIHGADINKPGLVFDQLNAAILQGEMTAPTRAVLEKQVTGNDGGAASTVNAAELTALVLGSPEFQRH